MWLPRWLRTLARRKSGEKANAESARQLNNYFTPALQTGAMVKEIAVNEILFATKPLTRTEVRTIIARVYAAGIANREEGSQ